ncbi:hypothetical protein [Flavobacterium denitrificans]|uniref:hypothetical protein n=1 Tax=Flavobacterium denitrificans TaxID=281361 RepID=UPI000479163D|nr:hypothetical protein [Flavobacterium denitrificans]
MNRLQNRENFSEQILEKRFVNKVLRDTGKDIDQSQRKLMSSRGFEANDWYSDRSFVATDSQLDYTHLKKHRFVDMKFRNSNKGRKRKQNHPIHNRIIWGHYNNIIKELHFGFTNAVKEELWKLEQ